MRNNKTRPIRKSISIKSLLFAAVLLFSGCGEKPSGTNAAKQHEERKERGDEAATETQQAAQTKELTEENATMFLRQYARKHPEDEALIHTSYGDIRIKLYKNTPLHRANFVYLSRQNYFDGTWFYRVSEGHVIQAGNTDAQRTKDKRKTLGDYVVPSEIRPGNYHQRGAVAAARSYYQNPDKNSDPYEFYIVLGQSYSRRELELLAEMHDMQFSEAQLDFYSSHPGAPHLDGEHTVFGEVIEGMDVVQKINKVKVDEGEWPLVNIPIDVEVRD